MRANLLHNPNIAADRMDKRLRKEKKQKLQKDYDTFKKDLDKKLQADKQKQKLDQDNVFNDMVDEQNKESQNKGFSFFR